jgi:hypothetical protein
MYLEAPSDARGFGFLDRLFCSLGFQRAYSWDAHLSKTAKGAATSVVVVST